MNTIKLGLYLLKKIIDLVLISSIFLWSPLSIAQSVSESTPISALNQQSVDIIQLDSLLFTSKVSQWRDSISVLAWSSGLTETINAHFSNEKLTHLSDSLRSKGLAEPDIVRRTDSLLKKKHSLLNEVSQKQRELQERLGSRYEVWTSSLNGKYNLDSTGVRLPAANLQGLPQAPNAGVPTIPGTYVQGVPALPLLESADFSSLSISPELASVGGSMAIPSATQLAEWQQFIPAISNHGNVLNAQVGAIKGLTSDPGASVEKAVTEVAEVNGAAKELQSVDQLKSNEEILKTSEQLRDPNAAIEEGKQQAINHFAGQEGAFNGAMAQMAKYKKRYSSIGSLSEIKRNDWLPKNGLKGTPFRERFRIGLHTGIKGTGDTLLLDFYPNASYRITGRLEAGLGAIYRVRLDTREMTLDQRDPVWGLSTFAIVKTFKAVHVRFEVDGNSFPKSAPPDQRSTRDWRWTFHSGIQTNFKLGKQWTGIIQMLYNFDSSLKDGFPERLTMRAGVQYKLSKKVRVTQL